MPLMGFQRHQSVSAPALFAWLVCLCVCGCTGTARVSAESARLRDEIVGLKDYVAQLERRNRELEMELKRAAKSPDSLPEDVLANLPQVTELAISRLSFARDSDDDGVADVLTLYIVPADGRGRFIQLTGEIFARAMSLPTQGEPRVISDVTLTPSQVRDAYRSSITGLHYTVDLPLSESQPDSSAAKEREVFARVQYRDGVTGQTFSADRKISLP
jgi:hypothetical protein